MDYFAEITVKGRVQRVGFRYFVVQKASEIGIKGYVKNLANGDVLLIAQGTKSEIETLIDYLKIGNTLSRADSIILNWINTLSEFSSFSIKH